jgi:hypothetical protein
MSTVHAPSLSGGYAVRDLLDTSAQSVQSWQPTTSVQSGQLTTSVQSVQSVLDATGKYGHLSVPLGLFCRASTGGSLVSLVTDVNSYVDAPLIDDGLFDKMYDLAHVAIAHKSTKTSKKNKTKKKLEKQGNQGNQGNQGKHVKSVKSGASKKESKKESKKDSRKESKKESKRKTRKSTRSSL